MKGSMKGINRERGGEFRGACVWRYLIIEE